jgi:hypothetical protein
VAVLRMGPTAASPTSTTNPLANLGQNLGGGTAGSGTAQYTGPGMADPQDPPVWVGSTFSTSARPGANKPLPGGGRLPRKQSVENATTLPLSQAKQYVYGLDPNELNKMTERAWYLGYDKVSAPNDVMGFIALWQDAVDEAAVFQAAGKRLSPMQVLEYGATGNAKTRADRAFSGGMQTQKKRTIQLTDPVSAKAMIRQAFKTAIGRDPTDAEIRTLAGSLTAAEKAHPQVQSMTGSVDAAGNPTGTTTETDSGGIDPSAFLQQQVEANPAAKEFQAASTYFPALMQSLGAAYGL